MSRLCARLGVARVCVNVSQLIGCANSRVLSSCNEGHSLGLGNPRADRAKTLIALVNFQADMSPKSASKLS